MSLAKSTEKVKVDSQLETLELAKNMLYPNSDMMIGPINISTFSKPSIYGGGDWYNYSVINNNLAFIWIGDITVQGTTNAAMLTSAVKSVTTLLEADSNISPGYAMEKFNIAINSITNGETLMTFFIAAIDLETGRIVYSNANHEFPIILPETYPILGSRRPNG